MTATEPTPTKTATFVLWFRASKATVKRRVWQMLGTFATEREASRASLTSPKGSGDYLVLPTGSEP